MSTETRKYIREQSESVYQALYKELYLNCAGFKNKTEITEILKSYRDLLEPEILLSLREAKTDNDEGNNSSNLLASFLAEIILLSKTSQLNDAILDMEASSNFKVGKSKIPFRSSKSALLKMSKKAQVEEITTKKDAVLLKLNELYLRQYAYLQKDSHDLGYTSYLNLYELTERLNSTALVEKAKEFLRDTEYVSRDMLEWFFSKRMDLKLKDADSDNMYYLLNSFELKEYFPKLVPHSLAQDILDETGINPIAKIMFDTEKRNGHIAGSFGYLLNPGVEMIVSSNLQGGVFDYTSFLENFGQSLSFSFVDRDEYFEYRYLREKSYVKVFSYLFKGLVYEPAWLNKHLKEDIDDDFLKFLYLKQLMQIRILSAKLVYEVGLYQRQEDKAEMYKEAMEIATHCQVKKIDYLFDIQPHLNSLECFKASLIEPQLRAYLVENYDEQWWRAKEAGDFLVKIWEAGGRISTKNITDKYGFEDADIKKLNKTFEDVLG